MAMQAMRHYHFCVSVGCGAFLGSYSDPFSLLMSGQFPAVMINFWHLEMSRMMLQLEPRLFVSTSTRTKLGAMWDFSMHWRFVGRKRKTTESWYSHHTAPQSLPVPRKGLTSHSSCSLLDWRAEHCATCTLQSANGQHAPRGRSQHSLAHFSSVYCAEAEPHVEISFNHWTLPLNPFFLTIFFFIFHKIKMS